MKADVPDYAVEDQMRVDPARTALVVIDMQNDFVKFGGERSRRAPSAGLASV